MSFVEDIFSPAAGMADLAGGDDAVFGKKPEVAPFVPTNLSDETGKAIAGNELNFDDINAFLNRVVPGFSDTLSKGLGVSRLELDQATSLLHGEIPQDVFDELRRNNAFAAVQGGFGGTPMTDARLATQTVRSSLDLINQGAGLAQAGQNSAQLWTEIAEKAFSPWTVSTSQSAAVTGANNAGKQATDQFGFNVAAAPDPAALAKYNTNIAIGQQLVGIAGGIVGGKLGGSPSSTAPAPPVGSTNWTYNPATQQYEQTPVNQGAWAGV